MPEAIREKQAEPVRLEKPAATARPDRWTQWVALTTTILAVCAAISSLKGAGYSTRVQLMTTQEANRWSYFQSKSLKQHVVESEHDLLRIQQLEARAPETKAAIAERIAKLDQDVARYDKEKAVIKGDAEKLQKLEDEAKLHQTAFGLAVMLLQIAIMLSSVGALIKRPIMWHVGLFFGSVGLLYMGNGFFLWF